MQTKLNPYLGFNGNAREAMESYETVFGGKLVLNTFKESHASQDPSQDDQIMHGMLVADNGITLMASDAPMNEEGNSGSSISISLSGDNDTELTSYFEKLAAGGAITEPLGVAPWGDKFGMLTDKFGIRWMVNITKPQA